MRTTDVIIKSNAYGLIIILSDQISFEELLQITARKFEDAARFFRNAQMAITFKGRDLSLQEEIELITVIMNHSTIDIVCIVDENEDHAVAYRDAVVRGLKERKDWRRK